MIWLYKKNGVYCAAPEGHLDASGLIVLGRIIVAEDLMELLLKIKAEYGDRLRMDEIDIETLFVEEVS